ncbi:MAG: hypothetical protein GY774_40255 [Planctomycetes bacterium]|nr:hypothetical protein [Planctomycetota bacterium]
MKRQLNDLKSPSSVGYIYSSEPAVFRIKPCQIMHLCYLPDFMDKSGTWRMVTLPETEQSDNCLSLRKTLSNGITRFRTDEIYETLIELVEVSGLAKAFLHNRLGKPGSVDYELLAFS